MKLQPGYVSNAACLNLKVTAAEGAIVRKLICLVCLLPFTPALAAPQPMAEWTVMIYMAADNDLEGQALLDLDEIEAGIPEGVNVVVMIDRSSGYSEELGNWHDSRVLLMQPHRERGSVDLREIARIGEVNTGDPRSLSDFIGYTLNRFPARRYGLILWDHGGGWQSMASDGDLGNGGGHDALTTPELGQALRAAVPPGFKFDLIGFDMCLMAQLEVAYEVADFAHYMVASEAIEPGYGWPYHFLLPEFGNVNATPRQLASGIVKRYGEYADKEGELVATQSAIDLSQIEAVKHNLDGLSSRLIATATQSWSALTRSMFWADSYEVTGKSENLERGKEAVASSDLLDIIKRMRQSMGDRFPAEQEYRRLLDSVDAAVVDNYTSHRHRLSHGLAIYAPPTGENWNEQYLGLKIAGQSRWPGLLYALHDQQKRNKSPISFKGMRYVKSGTMDKVVNSSMFDNTTLRLEVVGDNILWVTGVATRYEPADKGHLVLNTGYVSDSRHLQEKLASSGSAAELLMPEFRGRSARMEMEVAPVGYAISNGEIAAFASLDSREAQTGASTNVSIQAIYKSATEGEHLAVIAFDLRTWESVGIALLVKQEDGNIVPRGVQPKPEDQVTLLYEFLPDQGEPTMVKGETLKWNNGLELIMDEVPNGTYTTFARALSLSGESAVTSASVNVVDARPDIRALIDGAKRLKISDLGGIWSAEGQDILAFGEPLDGRPNDAQMLVNKETLPKEAQDYLFVARLDNRLLPTIHLMTYAADGETLLGREVMMLLADPGQPNKLLVKSLIGGQGEAVGQVLELTRTQRLKKPDPEPGPGPGPGPGPDNPPQVNIAGVWEGSGPEGYIWVALYPNGQYQQVDTSFDQTERIETAGVWRLEGRTMHMQPQQAQGCNAWGCQPFYPEPIPPFPIETDGYRLFAEGVELVRVQ